MLLLSAALVATYTAVASGHRLATLTSQETSTESEMPVYYANGVFSESQLPQCTLNAVCNKIDIYSSPWAEKQCTCPGTQSCSMSLDDNDGYTILDRSRQYKMCRQVKKLPTCRYFRDFTWTLTSGANNVTSQTVHCICPPASVAYIVQHEPIETATGSGYRYQFACSPESRLKCERKEPCRLFTVRKRSDGAQEVNTNRICQCPRGLTCPSHHTDRYSLPGVAYPEDQVKTYTAYCSPEQASEQSN
ncbi:Giant-lens -like protein [Halotydeus destructor]|nr:Giant-lens -like protein [Halotydeus destructor]